MDEAGFETAHIVGNSLGGYMALQLAARGRARSVVALAPAGGWAQGDESYKETLDFFPELVEQVKAIAPHADRLLATSQGKRRATLYTTVNYEHIPAELLAHQTRAVAACEGVIPMSSSPSARATSSTPRRSPAPCGSCGGRRTSCCRGRRPRRASATTGSRTPTGSSSTASATARSSTSRSRPRS